MQKSQNNHSYEAHTVHKVARVLMSNGVNRNEEDIDAEERLKHYDADTVTDLHCDILRSRKI